MDYESEYKKEDKVKYLNYLTGIANRYQKDCPTLRMVVIYTGDIERRQVSSVYNIGAVKVTLEPAFLSELDSEGLFRHLKEKVEKNELLDDQELMEFIILPLSYRKKEEKEEKIRDSVSLATQIQDRGQQIFALAGILTFTDKLIDLKMANKIRRMIEMTKVGWLFEQEKQQALAKAEQALAKAEEEKQQALAKAEAEKRQMARESVIKMLRKDYPTEEIAFIVPSFSMDDIEAVRREIVEAE